MILIKVLEINTKYNLPFQIISEQCSNAGQNKRIVSNHQLHCCSIYNNIIKMDIQKVYFKPAHHTIQSKLEVVNVKACGRL